MRRWVQWSAAGLAATLIVAAGCVATQGPKGPSGEKGAGEQTIKIVAKRFDFTPSEITVKKGVPVVLELTTADRQHGFYSPQLNLRAEILPGQTTTVRFTPQQAGTFHFQCDIFCGAGHEDMDGEIKVVD